MGRLLQARNWEELGSSLRCGLRPAPCVHYRVWDKGQELLWDGRGNRSTSNWVGILKAPAWVTSAKPGESKSHA